MAGIRLNFRNEPYWLDILVQDRLAAEEDDIQFRVQVIPLTTSLYSAATASAQKRLGALTSSLEDVGHLGGSVNGLPDLTREEAREGVRQQFFAQDLALFAIQAWEGVYDEEGEPAPVCEETVYAAMADHLVATAFLARYTMEYHNRIEEGNGSRPVPNGTTDTGPSTAPDAVNSIPPAPEANG